MMHNKIINLHISLLPWNRGKDPNFWSFINSTPKGVSIHLIAKGLDTGNVIVQKHINLDENTETFSTSYLKLHCEIVKLFKSNWNMIKNGLYITQLQHGEGSYHRGSELTAFLKGETMNWESNVAEFKRKFIK